MSDFLNKLSSYNFFNYLLPGILFVVIANEFTSYSFLQSDIVIGVFVYYFIGLVISRFGSLLIEPTLKKIEFLKFSDYKDFVSASKQDPKIEMFSEVNNMYRTISAMLVLLLVLKFYQWATAKLVWLAHWNLYVLLILLLILFLYSYRKQTQYIVKRIKQLTTST